MPRRDDLRSILVIGSGPIVIGQACEFDYSGTQACRVLAEEGYRVILANSNPATIMTDPATADRTYIEPLDPEVLTAIIEKERPDALLPTLGGQTALNLTMELVALGVLERFGVEVIGARPEAISTAEDRDRFKAAMEDIGLEVPRSGFAHSLQEAEEIAADIGFPIMVRPSFILGGKGTGIAEDAAHFGQLAAEGLAASPVGQILVEQSIAGWKEFELEVMRDAADNCVVVCSIENFDPMGVHTGDSITVAPAQTLTDVEYQAMRDDAFACLRRVGVETGGSNVQFAVEPSTGRRVIIEMNPRVSRSSALASKATGFPIAKIAARLAVGYLLNEIPNDITKATPASFEPTIDYVVTKIPRWAFEKLPGADGRLGTRMQSVGEVMAIGRTFCESLQKALRSLEQGRAGLNADPVEEALDELSLDELVRRIAVATPERIFELEATLRRGVGVDEVVDRTGIDPWFVRQLARIVAERQRIAAAAALEPADFRRAKRLGFSDAQLAYLRGATAADMRAARLDAGVRATFKTVDTCAAEFEAFTPYHYATYEEEDEVRPSERARVIILGSGPNRIGQGIEFDYCCVHASMTLRDAGYETVMINCNPETVSTDYDTSDRLYFEPLTDEDVANVLDAELAAGGVVAGVIVSLGGQTPLKLAGSLPPELVLGTSPASIDLAEDRERWNALCHELGIPQPPGGTATTTSEALAVAGTGRLPGPAPPELRPRRSGHGDRLRRRRRAPRHAVHDHRRAGARGRRHRRSARAGGPLPGGRGRGRRRRRARRCRRDPHCRRHGTRGGGRGALGRLRLRPAAADAARRGGRRARAPHPGAGRVARGVRPHQRPVRGQGRAGLRAGGQPPGQPDGAVRGQGHGRAAGHGGLPRDGGPDAGGPARGGAAPSRRRSAGCRCSTT